MRRYGRSSVHMYGYGHMNLQIRAFYIFATNVQVSCTGVVLFLFLSDILYVLNR